MSDYPWATLFGWEFIKAVMASLFAFGAVVLMLGIVAGAVGMWVWGG